MSNFRIITIDELLKILDGYNHKELHVHHTYLPNHSNFNGNNHIALQEAMQKYHVNTNGWSDIGQNITLAPDGKVITGRDFGKSPASIKGFNEGAFAVEMIGNFDVGNDKLEGAQLDSILKLAKYFHDKGRYIRFHRENSTKTCPGSSIDKEVFMAAVKEYGAVPPKPKSDVSEWAKKAHAWVVENGISDGKRPKDSVTREELWTMLYRALNK